MGYKKNVAPYADILKSHSHPTISLPYKIWQFYSKSKQDTKGISFFYNVIKDKHTFTKTTAMIKWEKDLNTTFTEEQWQRTFKETHKASHCVKHWELTIKLANRWHYTPYRISTYFPGSSPHCWRACGQIGNLLHMLWHCPTVKSLWNQVFQMISSLTGMLTVPDPALVILYLNIDKFHVDFRPVITHILLEMRLLILCNWKSTTAISPSDITKNVHRNYTFECLIAINSLHCTTFDNYWSIWPK